MDTRCLILALAMAASLGCGANLDDILPSKGSCNVPTTGTCTDYVGTAWSTPSSGSRACAMVGNGAVYASSACATAARVGTCRLQVGSSSEIAMRYYSSRFNATTGPLACGQSGGSWVAN